MERFSTIAAFLAALFMGSFNYLFALLSGYPTLSYEVVDNGAVRSSSGQEFQERLVRLDNISPSADIKLISVLVRVPPDSRDFIVLNASSPGIEDIAPSWVEPTLYPAVSSTPGRASSVKVSFAVLPVSSSVALRLWQLEGQDLIVKIRTGDTGRGAAANVSAMTNAPTRIVPASSLEVLVLRNLVPINFYIIVVLGSALALWHLEASTSALRRAWHGAAGAFFRWRTGQ